jgi:uncharacterized RDD family membrane protein YckC
MIPVLGMIVWVLTAPLAFGASLVALAGSVKKEKPATPPAAIPPAPMATATPGPSSPPLVHSPASFAPPPPAPDAAGLNPASSPPVIPPEAPVGTVPPLEVEVCPRAGFWVRLGAAVLDLLIVVALWRMLGFHQFPLLPLIAYHVAFWTWKGTTLGGVIFRLKIVRMDGQPLTFAVALVRSLASLLSAAALFLGFLWVAWAEDKRSWHDLIAGTTIISMPRGFSLV